MPSSLKRSDGEALANSLQRACADGNLALVKSLIVNRGANVNAMTGVRGMTPLIWACERGHVEVAQFLLDHGANVNYHRPNNRIETRPLMRAACNNHPAMVRLLLERGANPEARVLTENGDTPLHVAAQYGYLDVIRVLLDVGGANIEQTNYKHYSGETALLRAIHFKQFGTVQLLLDRGANIEHADKHGETPLFYSLSSLCPLSLLENLLDRGANIGHQNKKKETPLYLAVKGRSVEKCALLLDFGANIECQDSL